jgi:hypothetical protein
VLGGAENATLTARSEVIVTWQVRGESVRGASHPVQAAAPPGDGVAVTATTTPESTTAVQVPLVVTPPAPKPTTHATPPRFEAADPAAVLPVQQVSAERFSRGSVREDRRNRCRRTGTPPRS